MSLSSDDSALVMTARSNVYAYTWALDEGKTTLDALHEYGRWDLYTQSVMVTLIIWTADFLAVRTFVFFPGKCSRGMPGIGLSMLRCVAEKLEDHHGSKHRPRL
jgi:hypothetical protein